MNHNQSPSAGQPAAKFNQQSHDEMILAVVGVKEHYGAETAKVLIESCGVTRLAEVPPDQYVTVIKVAKDMVMASMEPQRDYQAVLMEHVGNYAPIWSKKPHGQRVNLNRFVEANRKEVAEQEPVKVDDNPFVLGQGDTVRDMSDTPYAGQTVNVTVPLTLDPALRPHAAMVAKLNPNDIIACLLEIAFKAQRIVTTGISNADSDQLRNYHALADAFAPLQQLPGPFEWTPAQRAKTALKTFIEAASVTIQGKEALEGIMAAMDAAVPGFLEAGGVVGPVTNDGWVIAKETVVEMPDGKKELGYTFISGLGVFTDEHDASKSLNELQLPLGYVIMRVTQLLPGYITPLLDEAVGLEKPVNEVFAVRNFDDAYVEQLSVAVADLATDGKRFRTLIWMMEMGIEHEALDQEVDYTAEEQAYFANYKKAEDIMNEAQPANLPQFRAALDNVYRAGVVPDMDAKAVDSAHAHDVLRTEAITLSRAVLDTYVSFTHPICKYCGGSVPGDTTDTLDEQHKSTCPVTMARQLIENES